MHILFLCIVVDIGSTRSYLKKTSVPTQNLPLGSSKECACPSTDSREERIRRRSIKKKLLTINDIEELNLNEKQDDEQEEGDKQEDEQEKGKKQGDEQEEEEKDDDRNEKEVSNNLNHNETHSISISTEENAVIWGKKVFDFDRLTSQYLHKS
ncbi:hypothetical protein KQX54_016530 [Cotesia glomerata]|uniref:Uncharacterized protein n=1 Tax=Cotesia glomerata TaxID=32391 RepID=A0AAV7INS1_COTGL|nr:hypothetical protein KQX54_016530 [Cotesia glomerata]